MKFYNQQPKPELKNTFANDDCIVFIIISTSALYFEIY
jgi:hypothetical protein